MAFQILTNNMIEKGSNSMQMETIFCDNNCGLVMCTSQGKQQPII